MINLDFTQMLIAVLYLSIGVVFATLLAHFSVQRNQAPLSTSDLVLLPLIIVLYPIASVFLLMSYIYDFLSSKVTLNKIKRGKKL
jgi:hypothetical protein